MVSLPQRLFDPRRGWYRERPWERGGRLYETVLAGRPPLVASTAADLASLTEHFGAELGASCWREFAPKVLDPMDAMDLNDRLVEQWRDVSECLEAILIPAADLERVLRAVGAPTTARELGWPVQLYGAALCHAREIRNRYTVLDLAGDSGQLEGFAQMVDGLMIG